MDDRYFYIKWTGTHYTNCAPIKDHYCWSLIFRVRGWFGVYIHSHGTNLRHLMFTVRNNRYTVPLYFLNSYIERNSVTDAN